MHCSAHSADRESAGGKPLRDLKGYSSLATILTMMEDQPPVLLFYSLWLHTLADKHTRVHMPVSCLRLESKSDSFLPTFLSRPHCFVSRCSIAAWPHGAVPQKGPHQHGQTSPWAFRVFHPSQFGGPKSEAAWSTCGEVWLTRNQFMLLPVAWAEWRPLPSNGCNQTNQRSLRRNQAKGVFFHWILLVCLFILNVFLNLRTYR